MLFKRIIINGNEYPLAVNQVGQGLPGAETEGAVGVVYMDSTSGKLYKCTEKGDTGAVWAPVLDILEDGSKILGNTPLVTEQAGRLRLECGTDCSYTIRAATVADWRGDMTFHGCSMSQVDGKLEFLASEDAAAWYSCYAELTVTGLTAGNSYRLIVDAEGCEWDLDNWVTNGYFAVYDSSNNYVAAINGTVPPGKEKVFTAPGNSVKVRIHPSISAYFTAGQSVARIRDIYINHADAGTGHTDRLTISAAFSGVVEREEWIPAGSVITSEPGCEVYLLPDAPKVSRLDGKTCVCFGDWVTAGDSYTEAYPSVLASETGMNVINAAYGPARMASNSDAELEPFCMYRLADAIATGDWSAQDAGIGILDADVYGMARYQALKQINWAGVDYITIAFGTNDFADGVSAYEFRMAINHTIAKILTAWPHIGILLLTPIYRWWPDENVDSDTMTIIDMKLTAFCTEIKDAGERYKLPVLDLYNTLGFNAYTRGYYFPDNEGRDPNTLGQAVIGKKLAARMLAEF